jgi:hypothetical protein
MNWNSQFTQILVLFLFYYPHYQWFKYRTHVENIFQNRQRTSATNGILKVSASLQFIKVLSDFGVQYYQDIDKVLTNETFEQAIKRIPGQSSGTSLKYFFMLAGDENTIKPDRMVLRFLQDATGILFKPEECQLLLSEVAHK